MHVGAAGADAELPDTLPSFSADELPHVKQALLRLVTQVQPSVAPSDRLHSTVAESQKMQLAVQLDRSRSLEAHLRSGTGPPGRGHPSLQYWAR